MRRAPLVGMQAQERGASVGLGQTMPQMLFEINTPSLDGKAQVRIQSALAVQSQPVGNAAKVDFNHLLQKQLNIICLRAV